MSVHLEKEQKLTSVRHLREILKDRFDASLYQINKEGTADLSEYSLDGDWEWHIVFQNEADATAFFLEWSC